MSRDLIFLALSIFTWGLGESAFFAFQPLYLQQLGANPVQIGAILGASNLASALAHLPAGYFADRFGRRPLLWAAWIQGTLAAWCMALAPGIEIFVPAMIVYGMTMFVASPLNSYVSEGRGEMPLGRALTMISAAFSSGAILGPLIGGWIGEHYGYRPIYIFAASVFILSTAAVLTLRAQAVTQPQVHERSLGLLKNHGLLIFIGALTLATFAAFLPQPLTPNFLQNERGISLQQLGQLGSISALGIVTTSLVLGRIRSSRTGYLAGQSMVGISALLVWVGRGFGWYMPAYLLMGGFRAARILGMAHLRSLVPGSQIGLAFGAAETFGAFAMALAPLFAGALYAQNPTWIYPAALIAICISLAVNLLVTARRTRQQ